MPLIFKLANNLTINNKIYEINIPHEGNINLTSIHNFFMSHGINQEVIYQTIFSINSEQIKDPIKIYSIDPNNIYIILMDDQQNNQQIYELFLTIGTPKMDDEICQPITQKEPIKLSSEIINKINKETLILFTDPDFINILSIYKRKPELFNILSNYIQNNNISESFLVNKDIDELTNDEQKYYTDLSLNILDLNLGVSQNIILDKLIKYSGNLNLTIRSIINDSV